jgi:hypothetical protein
MFEWASHCTGCKHHRRTAGPLTAKDAQIAELKTAVRERERTIAALHGELEKRIAAAGG